MTPSTKPLSTFKEILGESNLHSIFPVWRECYEDKHFFSSLNKALEEAEKRIEKSRVKTLDDKDIDANIWNNCLDFCKEEYRKHLGIKESGKDG